MPTKFQLESQPEWHWVATEQTRGALRFTDIAGDEYHAVPEVYRIAFIGRGSAVAYYMTALAPRETVNDPAARTQAAALFRTMAVFGKVDPWTRDVRGEGYINHEEHLIGHWGTEVPRYTTDYMRRQAFADQNARALHRAQQLGATLINENVFAVYKRGEIYQIQTEDGTCYYAAFVVAAMGLGPHRGLGAGRGAPKIPDDVRGLEISRMQRALAPSVIDLDRFMRDYPETGGIDTDINRRLVAPEPLTIVVHGANAGIDAVQRAWQLGHRVEWLCPNEPAFLKGNRLPIARDVDGVTRRMLLRDSEVFVRPDRDGRIRVAWTDDQAREALADLYVVAVGQDPYARGAVGDVLFRTGNLQEARLSMIWDFDQVFGLPFQTLLGYQVPGHRKGFGLQIIGASCEVLTRTLNNTFPVNQLIADFLRQLTPLDEPPTKERCDRQVAASPSLTNKYANEDGRQRYYEEKLANWQRARETRATFERLAAAYLNGLDGSRNVLLDLLSHQFDPTKVPRTLATILDGFREEVFLVGQLATPQWPATTAGASAILPSQLSGVRAVIAALTSFIPEYILRGDANFSTDDRTMLAVYIAQNFQGLTPLQADARVEATMSLRRSDAYPLGFHDDETRRAIQERWDRESKSQL